MPAPSPAPSQFARLCLLPNPGLNPAMRSPLYVQKEGVLQALDGRTGIHHETQ